MHCSNVDPQRQNKTIRSRSFSQPEVRYHRDQTELLCTASSSELGPRQRGGTLAAGYSHEPHRHGGNRAAQRSPLSEWSATPARKDKPNTSQLLVTDLPSNVKLPTTREQWPSPYLALMLTTYSGKESEESTSRRMPLSRARCST